MLLYLEIQHTDELRIAKKYSVMAGADEGKEIVLICEISYDEDSINEGYSSDTIEDMNDEEIQELKDNNCGIDLFVMENSYYTEYCVMASKAENIKIVGILI